MLRQPVEVGWYWIQGRYVAPPCTALASLKLVVMAQKNGPATKQAHRAITVYLNTG